MHDAVVHKTFPPGTQLAPGGWEELSIWGDVMAVVDGGGWDATGFFFDPERIAQRYTVTPTSVLADPRLVGVRYHVSDRDKFLAGQTFTFSRLADPYGSRGRFGESFRFWVSKKFADLGPEQTRAVLQLLRNAGFAEVNVNHRLPVGKWSQLLKKSFDSTQDGSSDEANAAYEAVQRARFAHDDDATTWSDLPGVYATTKAGQIRFILRRNSSSRERSNPDHLRDHTLPGIRPFRMPDVNVEDQYFVWYGPAGREGDFAVDVDVELGTFSMSEYNDVGRRGFEKRTVQFDRDELRKAYGRPLPLSTVGKARLAARYGTDLFDRREPDVVETVMELP